MPNKSDKSDREFVIPLFDYRRFWRTAIITFIIGFVVFMALFWYIATH